MLRGLLLVLCVYVYAITCAFPVEPQKSCRRPNGIMKIKRGGFMGEIFKVHIRGRMSTDVIHGSYSNVEINLGSFRLPRMRYDTCDFLEKYGIDCPIKKGLTDRKETIDLKQFLPPGDISGTMDVFTTDGRFIGCVVIETV